jgi:nucleoside-diphosphate-sugar epimerase
MMRTDPTGHARYPAALDEPDCPACATGWHTRCSQPDLADDQARVAVDAEDLLDAGQTAAAVSGSRIVYFTAGLPPDTRLWEAQFPAMLKNALDAARSAGAAFAYFDNTYMYPQDGRPLTEDAPFAPVGRKGRVRARMAEMVLEEMARGEVPVLIARAPEFYGPGKTHPSKRSLATWAARCSRTN